MALNMSLRPLSAAERMRGLESALANGWVELFTWGDTKELVIRADTAAVLSRVRAAGAYDRDPRRHYYCLTPAGGEVWERLFEPDWREYVLISDRQVDGTWQTTLSSVSLTNAIRQLTLGGRELYDAIENIAVERVGPWDGTYWKRFDHGWQVTYEVEGPEQDQGPVLFDDGRWQGSVAIEDVLGRGDATT